MTTYLFPYTNEKRDITWRRPGCSLSICSCGKNHTWINEPGVISGIPKWLCKTPAAYTGTIGEFLGKTMKIYRWPFEYPSEARDLRSAIREYENVEICSCPNNHAYTFNGSKSPRVVAFFCKTPASWVGPIKDLLDDKIEPVKIKIDMTPAEVNLVDTIRKMYEKPPDKNIIAALMMTQWIRAQRMPIESDRLIEIYEEPKKKGIV